MKAPTVIALAALVGCGLGIASTFAQLGFSKSKDLTNLVEADGARSTSGVVKPTVVVDQEEHDFGVVEVDSLSRHAFKFTNKGDAPLTLTEGATSCGRCTFAEAPKHEIAPGETVDVVVQYSAEHTETEFRKTAWINTNDPDRPSVMLTIHGRIAQSFKAVPSDLNFSKVATTERKTIDMQLLGFSEKPLEIVRHEFLESETADHFEASFLPLPADQRKDDGAKSGVLVSVAVKPGLPLGPIRQKIRLETNLERNPVLEVPIEATIVSDIQVFGARGWSEDLNLLTIGPVKSRDGAKRELSLFVRGPHRDQVQVKPSKVDPDLLKVTVGEPKPLSSSPVTKIPLTIEIPAGSPPVNYLGTEANKAVELVLETTHPEAKQIKLYVSFAVEN
jgi:hypothetical protein